MDTRYSASQKDVKRYTMEELRDEPPVRNLYVENEMVTVRSHVDRTATLGYMPTTETVPTDKGTDYWKNFGTHFFLECRGIGIFNIGGVGKIVAGNQEFNMEYKDCLYITKGTKGVYFSSQGAPAPAKFYMVSIPTHTSFTTTYIPIEKVIKRPYGVAETANKYVINQFIHPDMLQTCQLSMGVTVLEEGGIWNTMSAHTHERRMEIYIYFEVLGDNVIFHMMGESTQTRHIIMKNEEVVINPFWSIRSGAGTSNYTSIWAMGGENTRFGGMNIIMLNQIMQGQADENQADTERVGVEHITGFGRIRK